MIVGVICKEDNPEALALSRRVTQWIRDNELPCLTEDHISDFLGTERTNDVWLNSDILVVLGGDGTILRAIRTSMPRKVPILGIHMGYLGFLTEVTEDEVIKALEDMKTGRYVLDERTMLDVRLLRGDTVVASQHVLNDMVINKGALARIIDMEVWTNDVFITSYWADGLIISTPTGSTAYNLAAGGPIVHPHVSAVVLNPICPHVLSNRSIVLPDSQEVTIVVKSGKASDNIYLTLDGQKGYPLLADDRIRVRRGSLKAVMVRFPERNYFEILRSKLKWQER
ncbi:MAG TPA: NAD(+)/NADH kinase [Deltaproteobacteria bacterium]|nr:NAD(+)/NADH kinase [Deltaproteobacteria bacterium]HXK46125.1 NAD(+)/NADH kinase [Deltaproteobacteria bacterium]